MAKYKDSEPLSDKDIYGKAVERPYLDAVSADQRKVLEAAGQLPEAPSPEEAKAAALAVEPGVDPSAAPVVAAATS